MTDDIKAQAHGRWRAILEGAGVDPAFLNGKHSACPSCGGTDRFRYHDKHGNGDWFCSMCGGLDGYGGAGDGFKLLQKLNGWTFGQAVAYVRDQLGILPPAREMKGHKPRGSAKALQRLLSGAQPGALGPVRDYLDNRGLTGSPPGLYSHPSVYYDPQHSYPAMLGPIRDRRGKLVSIHRTWVEGGEKAPVPTPRKYMPALDTLKGCAIRLWPDEADLVVAEGIETALAAHMLTGLPAWSVMDAGGMRTFDWPRGVARLHIFADNDANYVGQRAGFELACRATRAGLMCFVHIPERSGYDWNDELLERRRDVGGDPPRLYRGPTAATN